MQSDSKHQHVLIYTLEADVTDNVVASSTVEPHLARELGG